MCEQHATPVGSTVITTFKGKRKLWELNSKLLCPVIGTCLTTIEIRKLVEKVADKQAARNSDYWLHTWVVSNCDDKNRLSMAVQKHLDRKFSAATKRFGQIKDREQLKQAWKEHIDRGAAAEGLWALLTHPLCDIPTQDMAYETIHMLSHQVGAGERADLKRLHALEKEVADLKRNLERSQQKAAQSLANKESQMINQQREITLLKAENHKLQQQLQQATTKPGDNLEQVIQLKSELTSAQASAQALARQKDAWQQKLEQTEAQVITLTQQLTRKQEETIALEGMVSQSLSPCGGCGPEKGGCTDCTKVPDLKGQKILVVGGLHRMVDQYKALVERCQGDFSHHDGGVEDSRKRLDALLWSADAVICATDCISHDAYYRLKKFCKQQGKRHLFVPSSSLSTIAKALSDVANDSGCIAFGTQDAS
ncbi:DUF2325 domain-containing protein [Ferrimonas futtsuensis]|uniref:DUF2325 domain-containing protein n=1 Tax=Ferrimonas futtsuensis TaxID=364764 RepID=UPI0004098541|nr:DUF2325 domain-containing protein [Ferrimonas futtsuensis]